MRRWYLVFLGEYVAADHFLTNPNLTRFGFFVLHVIHLLILLFDALLSVIDNFNLVPKLYIVPTPIGNLEDITFRAIRILKSVDLILAEDTRKTSFLLQHFNIQNKIHSYHKFNEYRNVERFIEYLLQGKSIALVSDAGTPGISDPGFLIVKLCIERNISVECLPGATAFIPALLLSGFACDKFVFEGFLPHKKGRQTRIKQLVEERRTIVLYESPHRIEKTIVQLKEFFPNDRRICICRELTKKFEEVIRGSIAEIYANINNFNLLGEMVLVIEGNSTISSSMHSDEEI